jgi:uncharacterized protein (TIGR04168 family)
LGDRPEDPCGRDWHPLGGDYGDPDLSDAIEKIRFGGQSVALVAFGHMHHRLRHTQKQQRRSLHIDAAGTVYWNAACVPRIVQTVNDRLRNFSLIKWVDGKVAEIRLVWVNQQLAIAAEEIAYPLTPAPTVSP